MSNLKPCPFCGGEVWIDSYESDLLGRHYYIRHVAEEIAVDKGCPMAAGGESSMTEAIEAWNRRANDGD